MNNLYVYYKLSEAQRAAALEPAHRVLAAGLPWCTRASLQARPNLDNGLATWMEVYEAVSDVAALEAALAAAVTESGLDRHTSGARRAELFHDLPAAADRA